MNFTDKQIQYVKDMVAKAARVGKCLECNLTPSQVYPSVKWYGKAHRLVWEVEIGPIPKGMMVCHECDNTRCVNIECLFLGTALDNMLDKVAKNRQHRGGPPRKLTREEIKEASDLYDMGYTYQEIGETYKC